LIYEQDVRSPSALKKVLETPILMQKYLLDGDINYACLKMATMTARCDAAGRIIPSPVGGKRRIDYLLTRKQDKHVVSVLLLPSCKLIQSPQGNQRWLVPRCESPMSEKSN
jgi:hypothetical protein